MLFSTCELFDLQPARQFPCVGSDAGVMFLIVMHVTKQRYFVTRRKTEGLYNTFKKSTRLGAKISELCIANSLKKNCQKGRQDHVCLVPFRECQSAVLAWRRCFWALPSKNRTRRLTEAFYQEFRVKESVMHCNRSDFKMDFYFMGKKVLDILFSSYGARGPP